MIEEIKRRLLNYFTIKRLNDCGSDINLHCDMDNSTCSFAGHNHVGDAL